VNVRKNDFFMDQPISAPLTGVQLNAVMRNVYAWMTMGLLVTAFVSVLLSRMQIPLSQPVFLGAIFAQLGIVIGLSWGINRMSATVAGMLFFVYAAITGMTFSILFQIYDLGAIYAAFFTTAGAFGAMTVVGLTTKTDLSKYSTYFMMGLIGLFIAMIVNMFLGSGPLDYIISIFGVLLFTALTAYDTQRIAKMASNPKLQVKSENTLKFSVIAALTLYLDFINLFLFMLRLFGGRD
jgi:uncharacterized protein